MVRLSPQWHAALAFCAYFASTGAHLPFWPLWLTEWGLSEAEVGAYGALGVAARMVAGFVIPILADRFDQRRLVTSISTALAAILFLAHAWTDSKTGLLLLTLAATAFLLGAMPLLETLGAIAARRHGFDFARSRAWGSVAFLAASIFVGWLVAQFGVDIVRWWVFAALMIAALLMLRHPGGGVPLDRPGLGEIFALFGERRIVLLAITVAGAQASHGVLYAYGSIHWRSMGFSEALIGWIWALSVLTEIALMAFAGRWLIARLSAEGALLAAGAVGIFRWSVMMADPTGAVLWAMQALHAMTFALAHLGMMAWVTERLDERLAASALALTNALVGGAAMAGVMLLSAALYPTWGGQTYLLAVILAAISMVGALFLRRAEARAAE